MNRGWVQVLVWAGWLTALTILLWVWWGEELNVGSLASAAIGTALIGVAVALLNRRRTSERRYVSEPDVSVGAALIGIALSGMLFGAEFGLFLVLVCAGLLVAGVAVLVAERRGERREAE
jgi:hypothetical protein